MILKETKGRGVDIVLNSLAEEKLKASVRCVARRGCFLEIGRFDLANDNPLYLELFHREASFNGINIDMFWNVQPSQQKVLTDLIRNGVKCGAVKPLPRTCFNDKQIKEAFGYMATGKHVGKVLIAMREEETDKTAIPTDKIINGISRQETIKFQLKSPLFKEFIRIREYTRIEDGLLCKIKIYIEIRRSPDSL